jgi:septum site-determining protein MinC
MSSLARPENPATFQVPAPEPSGEISPVTLKGTARGLEIKVAGEPSVDQIADGLTALLAEAPSFFAGNKARVAIEQPLPPGALGRLEEVALRFDLTITEIGPQLSRPSRGTMADDDDGGVPSPNLAHGSMPIDDDAEIVDLDGDDLEAAPAAPAAPAATVIVADGLEASDPVLGHAPGPRLVVGPIRSGVCLEYPGHVVIMGDVNPGAEVRAQGNIVVLGRLRGIAHAGVGGEAGFILALQLEPQQLRVGRLVARANPDDAPGEGVEIAYVTGKTIVVERYQGRLPSGLAASM